MTGYFRPLFRYIDNFRAETLGKKCEVNLLILIYNTQKSSHNDQHATSWLLARRSEWSNLNFDIRNGLSSQKNLYFDI